MPEREAISFSLRHHLVLDFDLHFQLHLPVAFPCYLSLHFTILYCSVLCVYTVLYCSVLVIVRCKNRDAVAVVQAPILGWIGTLFNYCYP